MEPPLKKRRMGFQISHHDIQLKRARNDQRLKSRFEAIFEKFGKDFSGVGDEIDLETGEIVVDNGHLDSMLDEQDIGTVKQAERYPRCNTPKDTEHFETRTLHGSISHRPGDQSDNPKGAFMDYADTAQDARVVDMPNGDSLLPPRHSPERDVREKQTAYDGLNHSDKPHDHKQYLDYEVEASAIDPKWQVPFVPQRHFSRTFELEGESEDEGDADSVRSRSTSPPGQSLWATPIHVKKGRQRVVWSAEVKSLLTEASSSMSKDINTSINTIDQEAPQLEGLITNQKPVPSETISLSQNETSFSLEESNHGSHTYAKRTPPGYWEERISNEDERRRFIRHLYNKRACK